MLDVQKILAHFLVLHCAGWDSFLPLVTVVAASGWMILKSNWGFPARIRSTSTIRWIFSERLCCFHASFLLPTKAFNHRSEKIASNSSKNTHYLTPCGRSFLHRKRERKNAEKKLSSVASTILISGFQKNDSCFSCQDSLFQLSFCIWRTDKMTRLITSIKV